MMQLEMVKVHTVKVHYKDINIYILVVHCAKLTVHVAY